MAIFFCHVVPWALFVAVSFWLALLKRDLKLRTRLLALSVWLASALSGVAIALLGSGKGMGKTARQPSASWDPISFESVRNLYHWTWDNCTGREDEVLAALIAVSLVGLLLTVPRGNWKRYDWRGFGCFAVAMLAYLLLPRSVIAPAYSWGVKYRVAAWALLFLPLVIPGTIERSRRWLLVPVICAGIGFATDTLVHWRQADRMSRGFDNLAKIVPAHNRVLFIIAHPWRDPAVKQDYLQGWPALYQAKYGGYNPWLFDDFPLKYRQRFPAPTWRSMAFNWEQHANYYDYVMVHHENGPQLFGNHLSQVIQTAADGEWTLWKLPGPRIDVPPGPAYPSDWASDARWRPKTQAPSTAQQ